MTSATTSGFDIADMGAIPRTPWPHWTLFSPNTHEFVDPAGDRTVRVVAFERLVPGGDGTIMSASYVPSHPNSYDVLAASVKLPLPGTSDDPAEPLDGMVMIRPECLYWQGPGAMPDQPVPEDHVLVNIFVHSDGPSGEPMITVPQLGEMVAELDREHPGAVRKDKGEFVTPDGDVHELLEACWERRMGRKFRYPNPPRLAVPLVLPITAYPWRESAHAAGVWIKAFLSLGAGGPTIRLVKLDEGASLPGGTIDRHRLIAIMAGSLTVGGDRHAGLTAFYTAPGGENPPLVAAESSLLWVVDWAPKGGALPDAWDV